MAPHVEEFTGEYRGTVGDRGSESGFGSIYVEVPGTKHETGDTASPEAIMAHTLVESDSLKYREVHDNLGGKCESTEGAMDLSSLGVVDPIIDRNPLVDDVD